MDFIFHGEGVVMTVGVMSRDSGVTLIEMLVAVSIMAILLAVGIPGMQDYFTRNRLDSAAGEFMGSLAYARSEAIRRGTRVVLRNSAGNKNWGAGWTMFVDCNNNNLQNSATCPDWNGDGAADDETTLRVAQPLTNPLTLDTNFTNFTNYITYDSSGNARSAGSGGGTLVVCYGGVRTNNSRSIILKGTGRARMGPDNNGNGIPEDDDGVDIVATARCS